MQQHQQPQDQQQQQHQQQHHYHRHYHHQNQYIQQQSAATQSTMMTDPNSCMYKAGFASGILALQQQQNHLQQNLQQQNQYQQQQNQYQQQQQQEQQSLLQQQQKQEQQNLQQQQQQQQQKNPSLEEIAQLQNHLAILAQNIRTRAAGAQPQYQQPPLATSVPVMTAASSVESSNHSQTGNGSNHNDPYRSLGFSSQDFEPVRFSEMKNGTPNISTGYSNSPSVSSASLTEPVPIAPKFGPPRVSPDEHVVEPSSQGASVIGNKQEIRRQRNRLHAHKSRIRKKNLTGELESAMACLQEENAKLRAALGPNAMILLALKTSSSSSSSRRIDGGTRKLLEEYRAEALRVAAVRGLREGGKKQEKELQSGTKEGSADFMAGPLQLIG